MSFQLPLIRTEHLTGDVYSFFFDSSHVDFSYLPGQYLQLRLNIKHADNRGDTRFFTIASSPTEKSYLMVTARVIQSAFKEALLALKPGDIVHISGPFGNFVFDEQDSRPKVFLAGGIGVTPFRSMARFAADREYSFPVTLIASYKTAEWGIFFDEFRALEKKNSYFTFIPTFTGNVSRDWNGEVGRIDKKMIEKHVANTASSVYYIVGPQKMVADLVQTVRSMGIQHENIRFENFTGY